MPERISLDKADFEAFLAENQTLVERSAKILERVDNLERLNRELEDELKKTKEKMNLVEANIASEHTHASKALRDARDAIARLMKEIEKRSAGQPQT
jgi:predicted  nucleic acid-binding Zn-ribbon protein